MKIVKNTLCAGEFWKTAWSPYLNVGISLSIQYMNDGTTPQKGAVYVQHVAWYRKEKPVQPEKTAPAPNAPKGSVRRAKKRVFILFSGEERQLPVLQ